MNTVVVQARQLLQASQLPADFTEAPATYNYTVVAAGPAGPGPAPATASRSPEAVTGSLTGAPLAPLRAQKPHNTFTEIQCGTLLEWAGCAHRVGAIDLLPSTSSSRLR
jgi:hypothetical protein